MIFWLLIQRELRIRSRKRWLCMMRTGTALAATILAIGTVTIYFGLRMTPDQIGRQVFAWLMLFCFVFAGLSGALLTADTISLEKREGTLGLLFLTDLRGADIVLGKMAVSALPAVYCLAAVLPVLSLAFTLGGITPGELVRGTLAIGIFLGLSLSLGLFVSSLSWSGRKALAGAIVLVGLLLLLPLWGLPLDFRGNPLGLMIMLPSPAFSWRLIWEAQYLAQPGAFWLALVVQFALCAAALSAASAILPHAWMNEPVAAPVKEPLRIMPHQPERLRRKLLDINPVLWLSARKPLAITLFWTGLFAAVVMIGGYYVNRGIGAGSAALVLSAFILHGILKMWVALEASRRFSEDARSGALELLLVTPLTERAIAHGWIKGLKRLFFWPVGGLLVLDIPLMGDADWTVTIMAAMGLLLADVYTLCWVGMWMGLRSKTSTAAALRTVGLVLALPYLVFAFFMILLGMMLGGRLSMSPGGLTAGLFAASYLVDLTLCVWAIDRVDANYRVAASQVFLAK